MRTRTREPAAHSARPPLGDPAGHAARRRAARDELYATGAAFTVVAWGFAHVYAAAQVIWPESFVGADGESDQSRFELLYLSFTTLTSVGLSDIVPALDHARSLVMVEQVVGIFYVALVVARLVGLNAIRHARRQRWGTGPATRRPPPGRDRP